PAADDLRVALRFWPDAGCDELSCSVDICSQPEVDVGPLSDTAHEQALLGLFASKSPDGNTPMSAALAGAEKRATDYVTSNGGAARGVVLLVTDGGPSACDLDVDDIAKAASDAYAAGGVLTFAVGLEGSFDRVMNTIATAGNTKQAFFI